MTIFQRVRSILFGIATFIAAILFIIFPDDGAYGLVIMTLSLGLTIRGLKCIIFYFTMARHMVGGKMILVQGVIILDFALFTGSISDVPKIYILLYLIGIHAFSGVIEVLRAMESKRTVAGHWKLKFSHGLVDFLLAILCMVFIRHQNTSLLIYSLGLLYSSVMRIINAFRKTTFILIE